MGIREEYKHNWYLRNRDRLLKKARIYYQKHRGEILERNEQIRREKGIKIRKRRSLDEIRAYRRVWKKRNREKVLIWNQNRRSRLQDAMGSFSYTEWVLKCLSFDFRCAICRAPAKLTRDHIIPLSKGGTNFISNIQPLCGVCNSRKNNHVCH